MARLNGAEFHYKSIQVILKSSCWLKAEQSLSLSLPLRRCLEILANLLTLFFQSLNKPILVDCIVSKCTKIWSNTKTIITSPWGRVLDFTIHVCALVTTSRSSNWNLFQWHMQLLNFGSFCYFLKSRNRSTHISNILNMGKYALRFDLNKYWR